MSNVEPEIGLVIPYWFLWRREFEAGESSGRKPRPCVVVVAIARGPDIMRVAVAPITHAAPDSERMAFALPQILRANLKLDAGPSWVMCDELNEFNWPGYDAAKTSDARAVYGKLPHGVMQKIRQLAREALRRGALKRTDRDA